MQCDAMFVYLFIYLWGWFTERTEARDQQEFSHAWSAHARLWRRVWSGLKDAQLRLSVHSHNIMCTMMSGLVNMASVADFEALAAAIPATKVEITVSCRWVASVGLMHVSLNTLVRGVPLITRNVCFGTMCRVNDLICSFIVILA